MKESQKDLDFLQRVAKKISETSKVSSHITPEDVFDVFKETLESMKTEKIVEMPIFMPVIIETKDDHFTARSYAYSRCNGIGRTEEEAINSLKEEINLYNKSCINYEKKLRIEEMVKNIFPRDFF